MTEEALGTSLVLTWPTQIGSDQQANIQATIAAALNSDSVVAAWFANTINQPDEPWTLLPPAQTPGPGDLAATCPVCQAEFKVGAPIL